MSEASLSTAMVTEIFTEEITRYAGRVTDVFDDGTRLFARSILPLGDEVRRKDRLHGGVALKADPTEISVHPYVYREVCRNGAIMAHSLQSRRLFPVEQDSQDESISTLREAIAICCSKKAFEVSMKEMRSSLHNEIDHALMMLPMLARLPRELGREMLNEIVHRFKRSRDRSRFALMNAVTSLARDTSDPDQRWRLEELGGGVAAYLLPEEPDGSRSARTPSRRFAGVV